MKRVKIATSQVYLLSGFNAMIAGIGFNKLSLSLMGLLFVLMYGVFSWLELKQTQVEREIRKMQRDLDHEIAKLEAREMAEELAGDLSDFLEEIFEEKEKKDKKVKAKK